MFKKTMRRFFLILAGVSMFGSIQMDVMVYSEAAAGRASKAALTESGTEKEISSEIESAEESEAETSETETEEQTEEETETETEEETPEETDPEPKFSGIREENGKLCYFIDGELAEDYTGWVVTDDGKYYVINGYAQTGIVQLDKLYYFGPDGLFVEEVTDTGWVEYDGIRYYVNDDGTLATGWKYIDRSWYFFGGNGRMQTGWLRYGGNWYYLNQDGVMQTGWVKDGNIWYYLNQDGVMQTGWLKDGGNWYYLNKSGAMQTGWLTLGSKTYYMNTSGAMVTGIQKIDGEYYYFSSNGDLLTDGETSQIGTYGNSGLTYKNDSRGSDLMYYRYGYGPNVAYLTFTVHGFEDKWSRDGAELVTIAENLFHTLLEEEDSYIPETWTVYIFPEVNPDGRRYGTTNNGPGRTTLYSKAPENRGIDINRSWEISGVTYKRFTTDRNYNGTAGFQAYEAAALRDFMLEHKSVSGTNVVVDLHGWENQLLGNSTVNEYYRKQYSGISTKNYDVYGSGYLITWARSELDAKAALVELPSSGIRSHEDVVKNRLSEKYVNGTVNMLKGLSVKAAAGTDSGAAAAAQYSSGNHSVIPDDDRQIDAAVAAMIKGDCPSEQEVDVLLKKITAEKGVWIAPDARESLLSKLNRITNAEYAVSQEGYLMVKEDSSDRNRYDSFIRKLMNGDKTVYLSDSGETAAYDIVTGKIFMERFEEMDAEQPYNYVNTEQRTVLVLPHNKKTAEEISQQFDDLICLYLNFQ